MHPGSFLAAAIAALTGTAFAALMWAAGGTGAVTPIGPYLVRTLTFSLAQAGVSTLLSVGLGTALALALARRRFPGRSLFLAALGAAAVLPTVVTAFAVVAVYGRSGWVADLMRLAGLPGELRIFGWPGILLAHVALNAPLVARLQLDALGGVAAEQWRLAQVLGFGPREVFRHLDLPVLRRETPGVAGLVFLLCFTSFGIVLTLGGGPAHATLEVAIYEALRSEGDIPRAAWLALVQTGFCLTVAVALHRVGGRSAVAQTSRLPVARADARDRRLAAVDTVVLGLGALLVLPLLASIATGLAALPRVLDADLGRALVTSVTIAAVAASLACAAAVMLAAASRHARLRVRRPALAAAHDALPLGLAAVPPFTLATGLFLLMPRGADLAATGYVLLPVVNAFGTLAFAYRFVAPAVLTTGARHGLAADLLGLSGIARLRILDWPTLRRPLAGAFAMSMALSFADFGVVALFGGAELRTLPYLMYERLAAYRFEEASALAFVLVAAALTLAHASVRWSGSEGMRNADGP
ncbi:MAG TPA: hypothetical protein VEY95_16660 [Azospirillaceae bacterium]|nr:hypothetical protein [Azospirillaceae bacterium]